MDTKDKIMADRIVLECNEAMELANEWWKNNESKIRSKMKYC